jgi:quinolinate synthase
MAESAEGDAYCAWLQKELSATENPSLHVIYINTSLETKAKSSSIVPTITCTSSNVLQTLLQASHEIPNLNILYGPDTYMGENLQRLFNTILAWLE